MIPYIFASSESDFTSHGLGGLPDAISCLVTEERNGLYELEMEYPATGRHFSEIQNRNIILAQPNYTDDPQPFRIYQITRPINGIVTVYAAHISYDLSGIPVNLFTAQNPGSAAAGLEENAMIQHPFTIEADNVTGSGTFTVDEPTSVRSWFGGKEGSLIDVYGGEWYYNGYTCSLMDSRGTNRGVVVRYGKNMMDITQELNTAESYTGALGYWKSSEGDVVMGSIVYFGGAAVGSAVIGTDRLSSAVMNIKSIDFSDKYEEAPSSSDLTTLTRSYMLSNSIGDTKESIELDFVQIATLKDRVDLCDTVKVLYEDMGISALAKCVKTVWNVLLDRYDSVELGSFRTDLNGTLKTLTDQTIRGADIVTKSDLSKAVTEATSLITGNEGGYVVIHDSNNDGEPDEILVMNTADISTATKVWRWNSGGLGYSSTGYSGTYGTAITMNGAIVADYITTGKLSASRIYGGTLTLGGASNGNGVLVVKNASGTTIGTWDRTGITATNADITGKITASSGTIGGFNITSSSNTGTSDNNGHIYTNSLYSHSYNDTYEYEFGIKGATGTSDPGYGAFYAQRIAKNAAWSTHLELFSTTRQGRSVWTSYDSDDNGVSRVIIDPNQTKCLEIQKNTSETSTPSWSNVLWLDSSGDAHFTGTISSSNATITGATVTGVIRATTGYIGGTSGFTIASGKMYSGSKSSIDEEASGVYIGTNGISLGSSSQFKVTSAGALTATNATITGTIRASSGYIGGDTGFSIGSANIHNGKTSLSDRTNEGVFLSTSGLIIGDTAGVIIANTALQLYDGNFSMKMTFEQGSGSTTTEQYYNSQILWTYGNDLLFASANYYGFSIRKALKNIKTDERIIQVSDDDEYLYLGTGAYDYSTSYSANMHISSSGRVQISSASTRRIKHDIVEIEPENYRKILDIPVVTFKYNDDYLAEDDIRYQKDIPGFIAEDVYDTYPIASDRNEDGEIQDWNSRYIIPPMLALIQEQETRIADLERRLTDE